MSATKTCKVVDDILASEIAQYPGRLASEIASEIASAIASKIAAS